jgi:hypothetical protein
MMLGGARAVGNSFRFTEHRSEPRPAGSVSWPQQAAEADKDAVEPLWGQGFCPAAELPLGAELYVRAGSAGDLVAGVLNHHPPNLPRFKRRTLRISPDTPAARRRSTF